MRVLATCTIFLITLSISAQLPKKTLVDILKVYESSLSITFSYDPELLRLVHESENYDTVNFYTFQQQIETNLPLKLTQVDDKYFTISAKETTYKVAVTDSTDNSIIGNEQKVQVLINRTPVEANYEDGRWVFQYKPRPENVLEIYSDGYVPSIISLERLINEKNLSVRLGLRIKYLNTVVIEDYLTRGIKLNPSNQQIKIKTEDLPLLPGDTDGDIFASIAALPGITTPDGRAGNLFIRGSETDQSLILFDNIPIYHRGHYYGTISPYNPKVVKDVEVYRSGFHPRFGDRVGGAIVIHSDDTNADKEFGVGANTLFGTAYGMSSINEKWGVSFGARRSYSRNFESPKLKAISESVFAATSLVDDRGRLTMKLDVLFEDYNAKISFIPNKKNILSFSSIFTNSEVNYSPVPDPTVFSPPRVVQNKFDNLGFNFDWKLTISDQWSSVFSSTFSDYQYQFNINDSGPMPTTYFSRNRLKDINIKQEFVREGNTFEYQMGIDYKRQQVNIDYQNIIQPDSTFYLINDETISHSLSPFLNLDYYGSEKWYFQIGVRSTYYSALKDFRIAPRFLANYDLTNWATLKGSAGFYNQYMSQVRNLEFGGGGFDNELWALANDKTNFIIRGSQSMFGIITNLDKWVLDIEAFNKTANGITVYEDRFLNPNSGYFTMNQQTYGLDLLLKREISDHTSAWMGYSYNESKITLDTTDQESYASKFVQPHVWYLGSSFRKNRWKVSASWKIASGLNAQSLDIIYAEILYQRQVAQNPINPPPNPFSGLEERYPNLSQIDISASYSIPKSDTRKWNASIGISLINILDKENLTDRAFRNRDGFIDRTAIGFAPNVMILMEW